MIVKSRGTNMTTTTVKTIDDVEIGMFIRYSDKDKRGKFKYVGEVTHVNEKDETFEMLTMSLDMSHGMVIGFCLKEEEEEKPQGFNAKKKQKEENHQLLEVINTKPKGWAKFKKDPEKFFGQNSKNKPIEPIKTQKEKVFDLVKSNPRKKLKALLSLAKKEIGGDDGQLSVQIQLALKRLR